MARLKFLLCFRIVKKTHLPLPGQVSLVISEPARGMLPSVLTGLPRRGDYSLTCEGQCTTPAGGLSTVFWQEGLF